MNKKKLCLIATGGTIASVNTPDGMKPLLDGEAFFKFVPALQDLGSIDVIELMQLDSTNIQPENWIMMAKAIEENYDEYDGFIITHGTDTMAYSSSALYYMLENLQKPVIFTGSQLSLTENGSDAPANLLLAVQGASSGQPGVYVAFHNKLMQGNAVKKLFTENFDGFHSINVPDAAILENGSLKWNIVPEKAVTSEKLKINTNLNKNVAVFEVFPGFNTNMINFAVDSGCTGIILKGYGAGNIPSADSSNSFLPAIDYAVTKGVKVVLTTQCIYDGTSIERYEVGASALRHGVIPGGNLTVEALLVKLMLEIL